ncbi:porin family protein [Fibrella forsythiae]|uniref:PorT family protein n=1 Tax=Fibrella forsythiae TaxID=2817061 RepID=A0ABS3JN53_9BACT|nr:porin family protein [Fibrella forsythiae]MBO0950908.1 PorT family protein [Fibrella forsythiae]
MRKYLLFILGLACYAPMMAQQRWRIAPTLGVNTSSVSLSNAYKADLNSGTAKTDIGLAFKWQIGAFAEYPFTERLAFRTGLFYTPKGFNLTVKSTQANVPTITGSQKSYYLEIPLLVNVAVGQKGFRIVGGPVFGLALGGTSTIDPVRYLGNTIFEGQTASLTVGSSITDDLLPTDTGIIIGLVRERDRLGLPIELGVYSQIGLSNYNPSLTRQPSHSVRNTLFGLKASYFFEVGR